MNLAGEKVQTIDWHTNNVHDHRFSNTRWVLKQLAQQGFSTTLITNILGVPVNFVHFLWLIRSSFFSYELMNLVV